MNLYELSSELIVIQEELIDGSGEISESLEARLDATTLSFRSKIQNIGKWTLDLDSKQDALEHEIIRLKRRQLAMHNLEMRLKEYVKMCMDRSGTKKLEYEEMTISIQKNPPSCNILDDEAIPMQFMEIIPEKYIPRKKDILDAMKNGEEVPGAEIAQGMHLRIR